MVRSRAICLWQAGRILLGASPDEEGKRLHMAKAPTQPEQRKTRIQAENEERILDAALDIFSLHGFRGTTIDQIADGAGMSKPNLLYYFRRKKDIYEALIDRLLDNWLEPLIAIRENGDPLPELRGYIRRKLEMSRDFPRESRLFANEILQGAPRIKTLLETRLRDLVEEKSRIISGWMQSGQLRSADPRHLIFAIWSTTQHYADFDVQVCAVLGPDRGGPGRFEDAARFLENLFLEGLKPQAVASAEQNRIQAS